VTCSLERGRIGSTSIVVAPLAMRMIAKGGFSEPAVSRLPLQMVGRTDPSCGHKVGRGLPRHVSGRAGWRGEPRPTGKFFLKIFDFLLKSML